MVRFRARVSVWVRFSITVIVKPMASFGFRIRIWLRIIAVFSPRVMGILSFWLGLVRVRVCVRVKFRFSLSVMTKVIILVKVRHGANVRVRVTFHFRVRVCVGLELFFMLGRG
jgi:hypothetical protein